MRVLELYSGIGGMHYALQESGVCGAVLASIDINTVANEVYHHNFPEVKNMNRNIESLTSKEIIGMNIDTILMSPPCQPFTRVGLQKDTKDNRSVSLFHVLKLIPEVPNLKHILIENVKGFEKSETRDCLVDCLVKCNFNYKEIILSPCQFGIPNSRHRYYLLAKKSNLKFIFGDSILEHFLNDEARKILPEDHHLRLVEEEMSDELGKKCYRLNSIIEENVDLNSYLIKENLLIKRVSVMDIRTSECRGSCCFTKAYGRYVEGTGSIFSPLSRQMVDEKLNEYEKSRDDKTVDFSKSLMHLKLRFFTPKEVSRLMCFPDKFEFPNSTTTKQKYRLLGNSINVHVVSRLIHLLNYNPVG